MRMKCLGLSILVASVFVGLSATAQDAAPPAGSNQSRAEFWIETGIMKVVPPEPDSGETFTDPRPIVELINDPKVPTWKPNFTYKAETGKVQQGATLRDLASKTIFRRNVWNLEFSFKPLRMIEVDVPQANGKMQRKNLWYLVYRVKNNGYHNGFKVETDAWDHKTYALEKVNQSIFFFPQLVLQANAPKTEVVNRERRESYERKEYLDRLVPAAMKPIAERERLGATLHDSVSITKVAIPVSDTKVDRSIWGVAIWEDVDARTDFFSVFVQGLTNAYKFEDPEGGFKAGDAPGTGRKFTVKNLQLNFHRAGDADFQHEEEVRFGVALDRDPTRQADLLKLYGVPAPIDHQWVYR
jgi:hypothetical protein